MKVSTSLGRSGLAALVMATGTVAAFCPFAHAQGPSIEVGGPPGIQAGRGRLGPSPGNAGIPETDGAPGTQDRPIGGRVGPSSSRAPIGGMSPSTRTTGEPPPRFRPPVLEPASVPRYGELDLPTAAEERPAVAGLTLD